MFSVKKYNIIFKIGSALSDWTNIVKGILQGSTLAL